MISQVTKILPNTGTKITSHPQDDDAVCMLASYFRENCPKNAKLCIKPINSLKAHAATLANSPITIATSGTKRYVPDARETYS